MFTGKSENKRRLWQNKHDNKTGCINHTLKALKERNYLDYKYKEYY